MENNQIKHQDSNKWKVAAIILIAVSVILAGATTVLAVKNGKKDPTNSSITGEDTPCITKLPEDNNTSNTGGGEIANARYLTVSEWGLRFQIPEEFSELTYEIATYEAAEVLTFKGTFKLLGGYDTMPIDNNKLNELSAKWVSINRFNQNNDPCKQNDQCPQRHLLSRNGYNFYYDQGLQHFLINPDYSFRVNVANYLLERMIINAEFM